MKISQENNGELLLVKIEVEKMDYQPEVDKALKDRRKQMTVPGFRPGQVPMSMVKKMYEVPMKANTIESLISNEMAKYVDDNKIKVLGTPMANDEKTPNANFELDTDFTFYFDVAVQPEFKLDLKKEKIDLFEIEPTEEILNNFVEDTRRRFGKVETPETVGENDMVYGHLVELGEDSQAKEGGIDMNTTMFVERIALKTIKDKFLGKKKGDTITFKPSKALKDSKQLATFLRKTEEELKDFASDCQFTISSIQRMTMAEMNEEFYKKVYMTKDIKDEKQFREAAKEDLMQAYKNESDRYFFDRSIDAIVKDTKFDLPEEFLKRWLTSSAKDENERKSYEEHFEDYLKGIRWQIIEAEIAEKNNINVSTEDIINYYKTELLPSYFPQLPGETEQQKKEREEHLDSVAKSMLQEKEQTRKVYGHLFDRQITEILKKEMQVTVKKVNMDEFIKQVSPNAETEKPKTTKKKTTKAEKETEEKDQPSLF